MGTKSECWHRVSNVNSTTKTADCSKCGSVRVWSKGGQFRCKYSILEYRRKVGSRYKYHEPNPGVCQLCGNTTRVSYDHDHTTGKFRGWLCINCNTILGLAHDDPEHLEKLKKYLVSHL